MTRPSRLRLALLHASMLIAPALLALPARGQGIAPNAAPQGGQVVGGAASIGQTLRTTTITQSTDRAVIDWRSFNVGREHTVQFHQPASTSMTLNRVVGPDPSVIAGRITANGGIALVNQSGVMFTGGAQVTAQSVIVSTNDIGNGAFMRGGTLVFDRPGKPGARIENQGRITAREAGIAALVAPQVANSGVIEAKLGTVVLAGATQQVIDLNGDGLVSFAVGAPVRKAPADGKALVSNTGTLAADGGTVLLTAAAADRIVQNLVRAGGTIHADTDRASGRTGRVVLSGTGGSIIVEGGISAAGRAAGTRGGSVAMRADRVLVASTARVDASGQAGGGRVLVGTDGHNLAERTGVAAGAVIRADATRRGKGGEVVVNSREATIDAGTISARGGSAGGDGGVVEVSSAGSYRVTGQIDVGAPAGAVGSVILDPDTLTIVADGDNRVNVVAGDLSGLILGYGDAPTDAYVAAGVVGAITGDLTLQANNAVTVEAAVSKPQGALWLQTLGSLTIGSAVTLGAGDLHLYGSTITINAPIRVSGANTVYLDHGDTSGPFLVTQAATGAGITAGTLDQTAGYFDTIDLSGQGNFIDSIASLNSGLLRLTNDQGIAVAGSMVASTLELIAAGDVNVVGVVQGYITADLLASGNISVPANGSVSGFDVRMSAGYVPGAGTTDPGSASGITLAGSVAATSGEAFGTLTLEAGRGGINQTAGLVLADTLMVNSGGDVTLTSVLPWDGFYAQFSSNQIGTLGPSGVTGNFNLDTYRLNTLGTTDPTQTIGLAGAISVSGTLSLRAEQAGFGQATGAVITAGRLDAAAVGGGSLILIGDNQLTRAGSLSGETITLRNMSDLIVDGPVSANSGVAIAVAAGTLGVGGAVSTVNGGLTLQASADIALLAGSSVSVTGTGTVPGITLLASAPDTGFDLTGAGGVTLAGALSTPTTLTIGAGTGGVTQSGGAITADVLGIVSGGDALLAPVGSTNAVANLSNVTAAGNFVFDDGTSNLVVGAAISAANIRLRTTGAIGVARYCPPIVVAACVTPWATLTATGTLALEPGTALLFGAANKAIANVAEIAPSFAEAMQVDDGTHGITAGTLTVTTGVIAAITAPTLRLGATTASGTSATSLQFVDPLSFAGTLEVNATGNIGQGATATLTLGTLGGHGGTIALADTLNAITTIGDLEADTDLTLAVAGTMSLAGLLQAGATANLNGALAIIETGSGRISADTLLLASGGAVTLAGANQVATLGASSADDSFTFNDEQSLAIGASALVVAGGTMAISTIGSLSILGELSDGQVALSAGTGIANGPAGSVIADALSAVTTLGDITLTGTNRVLALTGVQTPGRFAFYSDTSKTTLLVDTGVVVQAGLGIEITLPTTLTLNGTLTAPGAPVVLDMQGVSEGPAGVIVAGTLSTGATMATDLLLGGPNQVATIGSIQASGAVLLNDTVGLAVPSGATVTGSTVTLITADTLGLAGVVNAGTVALTATNGITQTGGTLAADRLTVNSSAGDVALPGTNAVSTLGGSVVQGSLSLADTLALTIAGGETVSAGGPLSIGSAGSLTIAGTLKGGSTTLSAATGISEAVGGVIITPLLSASTGTGDIALIADNQIDALGAITTPGQFMLVDGAATLSVGAGVVVEADGGIVLQNIGALALDGTLLAAGATVNIVGVTSLTEGSNGSIRAGLLRAVATTGDLLLGGPNEVVALGTISAPGDLTFHDTLALTVSDGSPISVGGTLTLMSDQSLTIAGPLSAVAMVLSGAAGVSQTGTAGGISTGLLSVSSSGGDVVLGGANAVTTLGGSQAAGNFIFNDGTAGLAIAAAQTVSAGGTLALTSGGTIGIAGVLSGAQVTLASAGAISESGAGAITAGTLALSSTTGDITLGGANQVATLGPATTPGLLVFNDSTALVVPAGQSVSAGSGITLTSTGALTLDGTLMAGDGAVDLGAASVSQGAAGQIIAGMLTGRASSGDLLLGGDNQVFSLGASSAAGNLTFNDTLGFGVDGPVIAGGTLALVSGGTLAIAAPLSGTLVTLAAAGAIGETQGGAISAGTLAASTSLGDITLGGVNQVGTLGPATTPGQLVFNDETALVVPDGQTLSAPGGITLTVAGALALDGRLVASGGSIDLSAASVSQGANGAITASVLSGQASSGDLLLGGANEVPTLGGLTAAGALTFHDTLALTISGDSAISAGGTLTLMSDQSLTIAGPLSATAMVLSGAAGVSQSGTAGGISTGLLSVSSSGGDVVLGGANAVTTLGGSQAAGNFIFNDGTAGLAIAAAQTVSAGGTLALTSGGTIGIAGVLSGAQVTLASAGAISESGAGAITAGLLSASAGAGSVTLGGANQVATLGGSRAGTDFVLNDTAALTIAAGETVAAGGTLALASGGTLGIAGLLSGAEVTLTAAGVIAESGAGAISAPLFAASTSAGDILLGGANQISALDAIGTPGVFLLASQATQLAIAGGHVVRADGGITLQTAGAVVLTGALQAGASAVDIVAGLGIDEKGSGTIAAGFLTASSSEGAIVLDGANAVVLLGNVATPGDFTLNDTVTLGMPADARVQAGGTGLITGAADIMIDGHLEAATLTLEAAGTLTVNGFSAVATEGPLALIGSRVVTTGLIASPSGITIDAGSTGLGGRSDTPSLMVTAADTGFDGLDARSSRVSLFLGETGRATGTIDAGGLTVAGGSGATLSGGIAGVTGGAAAAFGKRADREGRIYPPPPPDPDLFTMDGCPIAVSVCQPLTVAPPTVASAPSVTFAEMNPRDFSELLTDTVLGLPTPSLVLLVTQPLRDPEDDVNLSPPNIRAEDF